ncbi:MAG: hypothetical protein JWO62_310 [Acidimicrobiaceae bacterium]|nr:hypothetical protein [Acidimicrobiaceae bacterium]
MSREEFVSKLRTQLPEFADPIEGHFADNGGELLIHNLMPELRSFAYEAWLRGDTELTNRILQLVADGLEQGDDALVNAVAVSFVEDAEWWNPAMGSFIEAWPDGLRAEALRQRTWRPGH